MERTARFAALTYGAACYAIFFATFLYLVAFLADFAVPKTVDSGVATDVGRALLVNAALLALFGIQHSVMARPRFKRAWTRIVPAPIERSTYVLASSLVLVALFWQWRPIEAPVWEIEGGALRAAVTGVYVFGVALVLYSTMLIDHFDLFGLRQVALYFRRRSYSEKRFVMPFLYRFIRHPLYVGWLIVFWAAPTMTAGHFLFALGMSAYILLAIPLEERDLESLHGESYRAWRERTPAFVPGLRGAAPAGAAPAAPVVREA
jgi:protein-S-isoprenylcysteine O-methyltransferase Ste14